MPTEAERLLWRHLRAHQTGYHFRRQHPVATYVADFACITHMLIVEVDGGQHADGADTVRDETLKAQGWRVLRFWNNEVMDSIEGVLGAIVSALVAETPSPTLPRFTGEGAEKPSPACRGVLGGDVTA